MLKIPPEFVGRGKEIGLLNQKMEEAKEGKGSLVLIGGESGVGKTRLAEESIKIALQQGFQVWQGKCFLESLAPYAPLAMVLREAGLEHLLGETKPPKLEALYIVKKGGVIITKQLRKETIDSDIFMSMVNAVEIFVRDSLSRIQQSEVGEDVGHMGYGNFFITSVPGKKIDVIAVTLGRENEYLLSELFDLLEDAEKLLEQKNLAKVEERIKEFFASGKYEGIDYAGEDARLRQINLFENVLRGVQRKAGEKPVLIFLDDLQWSDPASLAMLQYLARNTRESKVLILCTYRSEELDTGSGVSAHPLLDAIEKMAREDLVEKIDLGRFDEEHCHELICNMLGKEIEREFSRKIYAETEGNALFVIETVKSLYEEGLLKYEEGGWRYAVEKMEIPRKVYEIIGRRLRRLAREEREMLDAASVLGEEFSSALLSKLTEQSRMQVVKMLADIERRTRLIKAGRENYRFDHSKIREVIYSQLPEELRAIYHEIAARAYEEEYKNTGQFLAEVVFHYQHAGVKQKLIEYGMLAAREAKARFANAEAISFYRGVLEAMDNSQIEQRLALLEELAEVLEISGHYDEALNVLRRRINEAVSQLEKGKGYRRLAEIYIKKGDYENAMLEIEKAEKLLSDIGGVELARAWRVKAMLYERRGEYAKAIDLHTKALEVFERLDAKKDVGYAHYRIGVSYFYSGKIESALAEFLATLTIYEKTNDLPGLSTVYNGIGAVYEGLGDYDRAIEYYQKALEIAEKIGHMSTIANVFNNIGVIYTERGEYDKGIEYLKKYLETVRKIGEQGKLAKAYYNLGVLYSEIGEHDRAFDFCKEALALFNKMGDIVMAEGTMLYIAEIQISKGEPEKAKSLMKNIVHAWRGEDKELEGFAHLVEGKLLVALGEKKEGIKSLIRAKEIWEASGRRDGAYYQSLFELGRASRDKELLGQALKYFENIGNKVWAEKVRREIENGK